MSLLKAWENMPNNSRKMTKITRKRVFAEFVNSKRLDVTHDDNGSIDGHDIHDRSWFCCSEIFTIASKIHIHVAKHHNEIINRTTVLKLRTMTLDCPWCNVCNRHVDEIQRSQCNQEKFIQDRYSEGKVDVLLANSESHCCGCSRHDVHKLPRDIHSPTGTTENEGDASPWLPSHEECQKSGRAEEGQILLYYQYVDIVNPEEIADWQRELCQRLQLTGKIRVATEGMNGTVGGSLEATELYTKAVMAHPLFSDMKYLDFKKSSGGCCHFPKGLKVGIHQEIVPMGVDPKLLSYRQAGKHLTPDEFHREIEDHLQVSRNAPGTEDTVVVDCRNFYESKIGWFEGAITPNIRKFTYWPEYVDKNLDLFQDKKVIMYCTGGIRCERGSAYLKSKGVCKEILQLSGGIHSYMDQYPNGLYKGKLFVFDDRYAIGTSQEVVANCFHCDQPWDQYQSCSSAHCHQLVLACPGCRVAGRTACCQLCNDVNERTPSGEHKRKEECLCTRNRERVPVEKK